MQTCEITFTQECDDELALTHDELVNIAQTLFDELEITRPCMLSVSVVSNDEINELNAEWRGIDKPTDVLSFECEKPDDEDLGDGEPCELGDIVLAPVYIEAQAHDFETTPQDETRLLFIHGLLHLLGYDHEEDDEAAIMHDLEEAILGKIPTDGTLNEHVLVRHRQEP